MMPSRKRKEAAGERSDAEVPLIGKEEYDQILNCAFDGPRRFASH